MMGKASGVPLQQRHGPSASLGNALLIEVILQFQLQVRDGFKNASHGKIPLGGTPQSDCFVSLSKKVENLYSESYYYVK